MNLGGIRFGVTGKVCIKESVKILEVNTKIY
jgi:hypothetical protein